MPRRKRRSTWGCVTRLSADRWRLRWVQDGERRTEVVHGTRRQADDRLAQLRVECGSEPRSRVTLGQAYERWWLPRALQDVESGRASPRTQTNRESCWRKHIAPRWADVPVAAIRPMDVQDWLDGIGPESATKSRAVMRGIISICVMMELIDRNVMDARYRMPDKATKEIDGEAWDVGGLRAVWGAVRGSFVEAPVLLMAFGSARVGESLGVRAGEVRPLETDHGRVAIAPIVRQVDSCGRVSDSLKTRWSRRPLALPGPMGERLLEIARGIGDGWLCPDGVGGPCGQDALRSEFERILGAAGVEAHPLKNLRKSWQTMTRWTLLVPPQMSERMMGHAGQGVTGQHYDLPDERDFAETIARAYAEHPFAKSWD